MRAIASVSDKRGLAEFLASLKPLNLDLYSTGNTQRAVAAAGVAVRNISELTGFPEILDGRVKTLHPKVHGGLLAVRSNAAQMQELASHQIGPIDLVVVNLYPFVETISNPGVSLEEALENIDIGGPTMIRAAAKNFPSVTVVVDPADYNWVAEKLLGHKLALEERRKLAQKAFQHVAAYDTAIATYLRGNEEPFTEEFTIALKRLQPLHYGENPHQKAAFYREQLPPAGSIATAKQLSGKELSYNNLLEADSAWGIARDFAAPTVAIIKHNNPCGLASHGDLAEAYRRAFEGDTVSAYGGIVAVNRPLTLAMAEAMRKVFYEIVIAPGYEPAALDLLKRKKDLRVLEVPGSSVPQPYLDYRRVSGGMLVQTGNVLTEDSRGWKSVTSRQATPQQLLDLAFAWKAVKHVKSNAIVLVKDEALVGMGTGQPNRVVSVHLALRAAGEKATGAVLASDAFFPFSDGVEMAIQGGVAAITQPGGSIRDEEVIAAAEKAGVTMLFTGVRHFKH